MTAPLTVPDAVEIELKLALPPHQVARFLKLMARRRERPLQHELLSRYFDTPDFALAQAGVALRVRRSGRRWVQTLKTEGERAGGLSRRAEYEMAVRRGAPDWTLFPAEAQALVPEPLREQLVPAFETRFARTAWLLAGAGGEQIEVALDQGEVRTLKGTGRGVRSEPICEIELELKAGQPDALFALAQAWAQQLDCVPLDASKAERAVRLARGEAAAPVKAAPLALDPAMRVEDGFAAICQACLAQFQGNLPGLRQPPAQATRADEIECVHQARVALRRLRAALRLYRRVCEPPDELMNGLRRLAAALGPARDWDVLWDETLPAIAPHYADAGGWQRGMDVLDAQRAAAHAALQLALTEARPGAWLLAFQRWLLQRGWRDAPAAQRAIQDLPLRKWARVALRKGHRRIVRRAQDFAHLQAAQRHALRIAIKRQRYAVEFFENVFSSGAAGHPRRQDRYLAALREAQDSLGRRNDTRVALDLLSAAHTDAGPMGDFAFGWLAARQADPAADQSAAQVDDLIAQERYW